MEVPLSYTISCLFERKYITEKNEAEASDGAICRGSLLPNSLAGDPQPSHSVLILGKRSSTQPFTGSHPGYRQ